MIQLPNPVAVVFTNFLAAFVSAVFSLLKSLLLWSPLPHSNHSRLLSSFTVLEIEFCLEMFSQLFFPFIQYIGTSSAAP